MPETSASKKSAESGDSGVCPLCRGQGFVVDLSADGLGAATRCSCVENVSVPVKDLLVKSGVPDRYRDCRLSTFSAAGAQGGERDQLLRALADCKRYLSGFLRDDGQFSDGGLIFVGPPGVGKTHLAVAVLAELIHTYRVKARFVDFTSLIHAIQSTFDSTSPSSKRQVLDPVTHAEVLVLDELGAQKPTRFVWETLYLIMNTRYSRRLPTLFTTNYRLDEPVVQQSLDRGADSSQRRERLSDRIGDVLMSRLYEMAKPVVIDAAPDYRREFMAHQHRT